MASDTTAAQPASTEKHHGAFFRQSGWLMVATIASGFMSLGVHVLSKFVPETEYSIFGTLLMVTACLPTLPLQMVYSQQTASALATHRERQLAGMIRHGWAWTFFLWAIATVVVLAFQGHIVERWQLSNVAALWMTLATVLMNLWMPVFSGVLQGRQDFLWLGWATMASGILRFLVAAVLVLSIHAGATGMMLGAGIGIGAWAGIGVWRSRDLWSAHAERFDGSAFLKQVVPLMLGFGACQFLFTADTLFAKAWFGGDEMAKYVAAGTLSRALLWLVLPLAAVMFPKIVHSHAKSEKSNLMGIVLLGTAVLAICGGLGLCLVGPIVVKLVFKPGYVHDTVALLPWYAGAMVPLALANVLVNDLLARARFRIVPFMVLLAVTYGFTLPYVLNHYPGRLEVVLQTLTAYNVLMLVGCGLFAWRDKKATMG
jgi:O-antigen/teichoic acid export membrane protein